MKAQSRAMTHAAVPPGLGVIRAGFARGVVFVVATAWGLIILLQVTGHMAFIHHQQLFGNKGSPSPASLLAFVVAWQVMVVAMMAPSSLPLLGAVAADGRVGQPGRARRTGFVAGYVLVWTLFGLLALFGDSRLHVLANSSPWLYSHSSLITGALLLTVAAHQVFAPLAWCERLDASAVGLLLQPGTQASLRAGTRHGLAAVCGCWALMLLMFTAGVGNLGWMATLTMLIWYERWGRERYLLSRVVGAAALVVGVAALLVGSAQVVLP